MGIATRRELETVVSYARHALKCVARGEPREARVAGRAFAHAVWEHLSEQIGPPRVGCPFCGWRGRRFRPFVSGVHVRRDALCPRCRSLERHREFLPIFQKVRELVRGTARVLDIAPMQAFSDYCRARGDLEYVSIDRDSPVAMCHMDVQRLALKEASFDIVVCYHVLDYVPDDRRALREIARVLRSSGIAILQEVTKPGKGTEEWGEPRRDEYYRIRQYGDDFVERVREAGFAVMTLRTPSAPSIHLAAKQRREDLQRLVNGGLRSRPNQE
jgi:SAM-dependent methyltransferase